MSLEFLSGFWRTKLYLFSDIWSWVHHALPCLVKRAVSSLKTTKIWTMGSIAQHRVNQCLSNDLPSASGSFNQLPQISPIHILKVKQPPFLTQTPLSYAAMREIFDVVILEMAPAGLAAAARMEKPEFNFAIVDARKSVSKRNRTFPFRCNKPSRRRRPLLF